MTAVTAHAALDAAIAANPAPAAVTATATPAPGATTTTAEPGKEAAKPEDKLASRFEALAKGDAKIREERKALESDRAQLAEVAKLREALDKKDAPTFFKIMESAGFKFDDAVVQWADYMKGQDTPPTEAALALAKAKELEARLAAKDEEIKAHQTQTALKERIAEVGELAKASPEKWEVINRLGAEAHTKVYEAVAEAWGKLGSPDWSADDFKTAVLTTLDHVEDEYAETVKRFSKTTKPAAAQESGIRAPDKAQQRNTTISQSVGGTSPLPKDNAQRRNMSREEALSAAIAAHRP